MPATITASARVQSAISFINNLDVEDVYIFAGKIDPWEDEENPDQTSTSNASMKDINGSNVFMKKTSAAGCILGLNRFNWTSGVVYTQWDDKIELGHIDEWDSSTQPFYVFVQDASLGPLSYNIYMCIDNKNDSPSIDVPAGQNISIDTYPDGYKWKFMYNVDDDILNYLNDAFIPCPHVNELKTEAHLSVEENAIPGSIDRIKITNGGAGYSYAQTHISIVGDGSGATASPTIIDGIITYVTITNPGAGYSNAVIDVTGDGSDADLDPVISPSTGHGASSFLQLIASHVLHKGGFIDTEDDHFPTIGAYRRIGLLRDAKSPTGDPVFDLSYDLTSNILVNNIINGPFPTAKRITGDVSQASALLFNIDQSTFYITDKRGSFVIGERVHLDDDPAVLATVSKINNNENVSVLSGDIIYYENMQFVSRKSGQSETFIFSIEF